jgi:preprotein translocase subunit SecA
MIEQRCEPSPEGFWVSACDAMARLRCPEAEDALLQWLRRERDPERLSVLGWHLCELCTTNGYPAVHELACSDRYDLTIVDLRRLVLALGEMTGRPVPHAEAWRPEIIRRRERNERALNEFRAEMGRESLERWLEGDVSADEESQEDDENELGQPIRDADDPRLGGADDETVRRGEARVGRNDPCPCGSGKKYKKCCLKTNERRVA